jgi:hypothetical protein
LLDRLHSRVLDEMREDVAAPYVEVLEQAVERVDELRTVKL